jgi:hypothetical protein
MRVAFTLHAARNRLPKPTLARRQLPLHPSPIARALPVRPALEPVPVSPVLICRFVLIANAIENQFFKMV